MFDGHFIPLLLLPSPKSLDLDITELPTPHSISLHPALIPNPFPDIVCPSPSPVGIGDHPCLTLFAIKFNRLCLFILSRQNFVFSDMRGKQRTSNLQKMQIARSDKPVTLYDLDVVTSVEYRVKSPQGVQFRRWATQQLRSVAVYFYLWISSTATVA